MRTMSLKTSNTMVLLAGKGWLKKRPALLAGLFYLSENGPCTQPDFIIYAGMLTNNRRSRSYNKIDEHKVKVHQQE